MSGLGPMSGQRSHFNVDATEKIAYAIWHYGNEVRRLEGVLDRRLAQAQYLAGYDYGSADMASYPCINIIPDLTPEYAGFIHMKRWYVAICARPAIRRAQAL